MDNFVFFLVAYGVFNLLLLFVNGVETFINTILTSGSLKRWE